MVPKILFAAAAPAALLTGLAPAAAEAHTAPPPPAMAHHHAPCPPRLVYRYAPETITLTPAGHGLYRAELTGPLAGAGTARADRDGYVITKGHMVLHVVLFAQTRDGGQFTLRGQPGDVRVNGTYHQAGNGAVRLDGTMRVAVRFWLPPHHPHAL